MFVNQTKSPDTGEGRGGVDSCVELGRGGEWNTDFKGFSDAWSAINYIIVTAPHSNLCIGEWHEAVTSDTSLRTSITAKRIRLTAEFNRLITSTGFDWPAVEREVWNVTPLLSMPLAVGAIPTSGEWGSMINWIMAVIMTADKRNKRVMVEHVWLVFTNSQRMWPNDVRCTR